MEIKPIKLWSLCIALLSLALSLQAQSTIVPGASLVVEYNGDFFYEGPIWDPATAKLYFTTPNDAPYNVYRLDSRRQASVWYTTPGAINGTLLSKDGRMLAAVQNDRAIASYRIGPNGPEDIQILAQNPSWNRPNDLWETDNGHIYFSGPVWGGSFQAVYHLDPQGNVSEIITNMPKPNGLCTSLDDSLLYVSDSDRRYWMVYPIKADGSVGSGSIFFRPTSSAAGVPDGMTIDELGNLYFTGLGGLWIVSPEGEELDFISIPTGTSNVTFGGPEGKTLYITGSKYVYSLETSVRGRAYATNPQVTLGDVDGDGMVTIVDSLLIAQFYVGIEPNINTAGGDVTGCDGTVDIVDALVIAQYYVGLISDFPCQK